MKLKILPGTETFKKLTDLKKEIDSCTAAAKDIVKELGGTGHCKNRHVAAGGISAIEFSEKPKGWKKVGETWQNLYIPLAKNKELWDKISALPKVPMEDLQDIIKYKSHTYEANRGLVWADLPGIYWHKKYVLIETDQEDPWKPNKDMIEILESEYKKLKK